MSAYQNCHLERSGTSGFWTCRVVERPCVPFTAHNKNLVFVAIALRLRKLLCPRLPNIFFGKSSHPIQRRLQLA
jgi:hypothetical protein